MWLKVMLMSVYKLSNGHGNALVWYHLVLTQRCSGAAGDDGCTGTVLVLYLWVYCSAIPPLSCVASLVKLVSWFLCNARFIIQREVHIYFHCVCVCGWGSGMCVFVCVHAWTCTYACVCVILHPGSTLHGNNSVSHQRAPSMSSV